MIRKIWKNWDDRQKANAIRIAGLFVALLAVFTLLSVASYLFTWRQDQSFLTDPSMMKEAAGSVSNWAGKFGLKWSNLLVRRWFGLGSLAFLVLLVAVSARMIARKWPYSLLKTALVTVTGAFVASLIFAVAGRLFKVDNAFGSGLGGACGTHVVNWSANLVSTVPTVLWILILLVCWLYFSSSRFSRWFSSLGADGDGDASGKDAPDNRRGKDAIVSKPVEKEPARSAVTEPVKPAPTKPAPVEPKPLEPSPVQSKPVAFKPEVQKVEKPEPVKVEASTESEGQAGLSEVDRGTDISTDVKKPLPRIDVRMDPPEGLPSYQMPPLDILGAYSDTREDVSNEELIKNNNKIRAALANYGIDILDVKAIVGPTVTLYKVYPAPGVKISTIKSRQEDIALSLSASRGVRVVILADAVGIEVANDRPSTVPLRGLLNSDAFRDSKAELPVAIGLNIQKKVRVFDLADAPHLLVAGATKQGKSVGLNVLIASLLYSKHPSELKFVFVDPKMVEFSAYSRMLKHYLAVMPTAADEEQERESAIVKQPKEAEAILRSLCIEMDERYALLSKAFVNNVKLYNDKYRDRHLLPTDGHRFMPYIVVVIDEYADLAMSGGTGSEARNMQKSIMGSIVRLAQKGRAAGIHVVIATQRPSVDVITGLIKANFPARIAFRVSTRVDSNTILDNTGAEKLIGRGDMLYYAGVETERIQCGFISNDEINEITTYIGNQTGYGQCYNTPYYLPDPSPADGEGGAGMIDMKDLDERFEEAARMVVMSQRGSTSDLQRKLGMGYAKAGRVMDQLEAAGIVGPQEGSKPRQVLVSTFEELDSILKAYLK